MNRLFFVLLSSLLAVAACKENQPNDPVFDRSAMLTRYADSVLKPGSLRATAAISVLLDSIQNLRSEGDITALQGARNAWKKAVVGFQEIEAAYVGPAADVQVQLFGNYFPVDTAGLKSRLANGNWGLNDAATLRGFSAIEYLLWQPGIPEQTLAEQSRVERGTYLHFLTTQLDALITEVSTAWAGNYRNSFVEADGDDVASSLSIMVNQFNKGLDHTKRYRVGIPTGYTGNDLTGPANPGKGEGMYSGSSALICEAYLRALQRVLNGNSPYTQGLGLLDYADAVGVPDAQGRTLGKRINDQFELCFTAVRNTGNNWAGSMKTDRQPQINLFNELKKLLVLTKVELPSAVGVSISYQDSDGD
jgi:hypothetical protein